MAFESLSEVLWMQGHGPYVWSVYGIGLVLISVLVGQARSLRKKSRLTAKRYWNRGGSRAS